ncbi:MAG: N5-carboxyaminoimidazole ribonucleotide synthase [Candidatus Tectimicrobiota bacterium]|nr:MAG: N5-carboxyaminoimidazole ribonucleotide synthase [Candidatus Tectomicrobia bacterium]
MIVGILGGGQLARMLALAGFPLGLTFRFLDQAADACAFPLGEALVGRFDDPRLLERLAAGAAVVTYEFENISLRGVESLAPRVPLHPAPRALAVKQDRLREKQLFAELGIPTAAFAPVTSEDELRQAAKRLGFPMVLKTRSQGYDGKGQWIIGEEGALGQAWRRLPRVPLLAEQFIGFDREVSIVAVRGASGEEAYYPLAENVHRQGILLTSRSRPADPAATIAQAYAQRLLAHFDYVGVLALELFQVGGRLLANEFAPRVHNTGHWTIEGAETSQFENHLRAILGFPLGATAPVGAVAMVNCLGKLPDPRRLLGIPGVHLHLYGKAVRPRRKVGHVTIRAADEGDLEAKLREVEAVLAACEA